MVLGLLLVSRWLGVLNDYYGLIMMKEIISVYWFENLDN